MSESPRPAAPKALGAAGKALWTRIVKDLPEGWRFDERELRALEQAAKCADDAAGLEAAIALEGYTIPGSKGQLRPHPGLDVVIRLRNLEAAAPLAGVGAAAGQDGVAGAGGTSRRDPLESEEGSTMKPIDEKPAAVAKIHAAYELSCLSAFASWAVLEDGDGRRAHPERRDSDVQRALRELMHEHYEEPPTTLEAHAAARRVLDDHDGRQTFALWERGDGWGMGHWPTSDGLETRVRAVTSGGL